MPTASAVTSGYVSDNAAGPMTIEDDSRIGLSAGAPRILAMTISATIIAPPAMTPAVSPSIDSESGRALIAPPHTSRLPPRGRSGADRTNAEWQDELKRSGRRAVAFLALGDERHLVGRILRNCHRTGVVKPAVIVGLTVGYRGAQDTPDVKGDLFAAGPASSAELDRP